MQAVILAGGKGTRLRPYTTVLPKPLMPVGDYPILEILIRQLVRYGCEHITITIGYHYELFQALFQNGKKWDVRLEYSLEEKPLGTIGPLRLIKNLDDNFLIMNGDTLTDLDFRKVFHLHLQEKNIMTIVTQTRSVNIDYGVVEHDRNNAVTSYLEKPELKYTIAMGVTAFSKTVLELIPAGEHFDFPDLVHEMLRRKMPIRHYPYEGYGLDIGRPDDYQKAVEEFEKHKEIFLGGKNHV